MRCKGVGLTTLFCFFSVYCVCVVAQSDDANGGAAEGKTEKLSRKATELRAEVADCFPPEGEAIPDDATSYYDQLAAGGNNEAVIHCYSIALNAINQGRIDEARRVLDAAIARIQASSAGDEDAKRARSKFHGESEKDFRGEPFEQAMVFFLAALVYMEQGDYENARAHCRSGALCDRSSEDAPPEEQYNDDLAEMSYLEALCNAKLNDPRVEDNLRFARESSRDPSSVLPPPADFNTIIVFFSGMGAYKYRTGQYNQFLRFSPGNGAGGPLRVTVDGTVVAEVGGPMDSMTFQARTRGDRVVDAILKGKAQFKTGADIVGDIALGAGASAMSQSSYNNDSGAAGTVLAIAGLAAKVVAKAANPEADSRALSPVPDDIYVFALNLAPGAHSLRFECPDTGTGYSSNVTISDAPCNVALVWSKSFGPDVEAARRNRLAEKAADPNKHWTEVWPGELDLMAGSRKFQAKLFVEADQQNDFDGILHLLPEDSGTGYYVPCTGTMDGKDFRLEFRDGNLSDTSTLGIMLGDFKRGGSRIKGDYHLVTGGTMQPWGQFKFEEEES